MKKIAIVTLALVGLLFGMAAVSLARAGDGYVVLQPSHSGLWADPANITGSFDVQVIGEPGESWAWATYFATTGAYETPAQWLVAYPPWVGLESGTVPLHRAVRNGGKVDLVQAGTVSFSAVSCTALDARVVLWGPVSDVEVDYHLTLLHQSGVAPCVPCDVADFSPAPWWCTP